eukprot:evm.model.scf_49.4 EVM.evm.TU.scf_49.4   scf_49:36982-43862(-)
MPRPGRRRSSGGEPRPPAGDLSARPERPLRRSARQRRPSRRLDDADREGEEEGGKRARRGGGEEEGRVAGPSVRAPAGADGSGQEGGPASKCRQGSGENAVADGDGPPAPTGSDVPVATREVPISPFQMQVGSSGKGVLDAADGEGPRSGAGTNGNDTSGWPGGLDKFIHTAPEPGKDTQDSKPPQRCVECDGQDKHAPGAENEHGGNVECQHLEGDNKVNKAQPSTSSGAAAESALLELASPKHSLPINSSEPEVVGCHQPAALDLCPDPGQWEDVCVNGSNVRLEDAVRHKGLCLIRFALRERYPRDLGDTAKDIERMVFERFVKDERPGCVYISAVNQVLAVLDRRCSGGDFVRGSLLTGDFDPARLVEMLRWPRGEDAKGARAPMAELDSTDAGHPSVPCVTVNGSEVRLPDKVRHEALYHLHNALRSTYLRDPGEVALETEAQIFKKYNEAGEAGELYAHGVHRVWDLLDADKPVGSEGMQICTALLNGTVTPEELAGMLRSPPGTAPAAPTKRDQACAMLQMRTHRKRADGCSLAIERGAGLVVATQNSHM